LQSYLIFTFALVILFTAKKLPECNPIAVMVLFQPFSALKASQIIGLVAVGAVTAVYTAITALDFFSQTKNQERPRADKPARK